VFFCNSGAEANEGAIKLARRYGKLKLNGAFEVITALNSFHGRTLAMTAATGQPHYQDSYTPLPAGLSMCLSTISMQLRTPPPKTPVPSC